MRKLFLVYLLIPFFSIAQKLEGQKLIDSLLVELPKMKEDTLKVNLLSELAFNYKFSNPNLHYDYANRQLQLSKKIKHNDGIAKAYILFGIYHLIKSDLKNARINYNQALRFAKSKINLSQIYSGLSTIYDYEGNYPKALELAHKSLKINEELGNKKGIVKSFINIGAIYIELENFKKAIELNDKALSINTSLGITDGNNVIYSNNGLCFKNLKNYDKAIESYNKAIEIDIEIGNKTNLTYCYKGISSIYFKKKQYRKSLEYCELAKKLNQVLGNDFNYATNISSIAINFIEIFKENKQSNQKELLYKAQSYIQEAIIINKNLSSIKDLESNYLNLSETHKLLGNYQEALSAYEQNVIYKDSVFNSENKETIKNLEDKREIELRDKQIKINKLSLEAKEKQKWLFVAGIGFLAIIGGLLFYQSRKRKITNLKLETLNKDLDQANKAKTRFFGILNHDLRGPVSNLVIFLQLQQEAPEMLDEESTKRMQDKTMTGAKNLLASMEDILQWSKSQMENFKPQPKNVSINQLFDDTKKVFSGYLNIKIEYQNPENIEIFTDDNYLKTIIRNLTSNSINVFTDIENPIIIWKAWQIDKISYLSITDNGPGANPEKLKALFDESELGSTKSGLGLHLIRDMAKAIDCEISVESTIGVGTTFTLKL